MAYAPPWRKATNNEGDEEEVQKLTPIGAEKASQSNIFGKKKPNVLTGLLPFDIGADRSVKTFLQMQLNQLSITIFVF